VSSSEVSPSLPAAIRSLSVRGGDKVQARETGRISLYPPSVALALLHVEPRQGRVDSHGCERVP
jgi:hypothetical protein